MIWVPDDPEGRLCLPPQEFHRSAKLNDYLFNSKEIENFYGFLERDLHILHEYLQISSINSMVNLKL
jgi:hypothetical protein